MTNSGCTCQSCNKAYIADLIVPDEVWEQITPKPGEKGAGLLCPNCIMERIVSFKIWSAGRVFDVDSSKTMQQDASRWNALLRCARIRMFGSAGFDKETGERQDYNNLTGEFEKSTRGWVHFGAEFWSVYPGYEDDDKTNAWGRRALTAIADDVMLKEKQATGESK